MQKDYETIQVIGKGSFGVVRKVRRLKDSKTMVAKQMRYGSMSSRQKQQLVAEVNILKQLDHPRIIKYHDRIVDKKESTVYIIMQYCSGGDLGKIIHNAKSKTEKDYIHESVIWKIFTQVIQALHYCHTRSEGRVLHRDIKPTNIFIDQNNNIKLGDFGLSREMGQHSEFAQTYVGTPYYMSPQVVKQQKYNQKSDVWSAGCLLYELAALRRPFQATNHLALAFKIQKGIFDRIPIKYSENLQSLIEEMLRVNPNKRISTSDILNIPIIRLRIEECRINKQYQQIRQKQEALKKREAKLKGQKSKLLQMLENKENTQRYNCQQMMK